MTDVELTSIQTVDQTIQQEVHKNGLTIAPNRRWLFIAKTYASVAFQLLVIFVTCISCYHSSSFRSKTDAELTTFALIMFGVCMGCMILTFIATCAKMLYIGLVPFAGFTVCLGLMLSTAIIRYQANLIMHAFIITAIATVACSVFVFYTRKDLTHWTSVLFYLTLLIIIAIPVFFIAPPNKPIEILFCVIGIVLFTGWLLVDTSMLIHQYSEDDWLIASMNITLDILNLFVRILQLMSYCCPEDGNTCCDGCDGCDGCDLDLD